MADCPLNATSPVSSTTSACPLLLSCPFFQRFLQIAEGLKPPSFKFPYPAFADFMDRDRIEVVQLLPTPSHRGDKVGVLQDRQMLADRLARHVKARAEFVQRLAIVGTQPVEQFTPARIGQRLKNRVHPEKANMQLFGCSSSINCRSMQHLTCDAVHGPTICSNFSANMVAWQLALARSRRTEWQQH